MIIVTGKRGSGQTDEGHWNMDRSVDIADDYGGLWKRQEFLILRCVTQFNIH